MIWHRYAPKMDRMLRLLISGCQISMHYTVWKLETFQHAVRAVSSILVSSFSALSSFCIILWEFLESDIFTFAVPNTAFGILSALATSAFAPSSSTPSSLPPLSSYFSSSLLSPYLPGSLLDGSEALASNYAPSISQVWQRAPAVLVFNLANLLIFDLANQRSPESVAEDRVNKPWRPIPRGKITMEQTRRLMLVAIPLTLALNYVLGAWRQGVFILVLTWLYNDLRGGDEAFVRELIISVAYGLFNHGSLRIAFSNGVTGPETIVHSLRSITWTVIISGVILTTMQVQDLKDVQGDRGRGRRTIVLFLGERFSRISIAFFICFWSFACARFWHLEFLRYAGHTVVAIVLTTRVLFVGGSGREDAHTWRLWCFWHASLYLLPVLSIYRDGIA